MEVGPRAGWSFTVGEPQSLVLALYIRDVAQLEPHISPHIPQLDPVIEPRPSLPAGVDRARLAEQWTSWWNGLLAAEGRDDPFRDWASIGRFYIIAPHDGLRELSDAVFDEAVEWSNVRNAAFARVATLDLMHAEQEVVRHAKPWWRRSRNFHLRITELPVAGSHGWRITKQHVMVTRQLYTDRPAYQDWLRPVVSDLA